MTCGIAPAGSSWQNRAWRALLRKEHRTAAEEAAGKVTKQGQPVDFVITTPRDITTHAQAPKAYCYVPAAMHTTWNASKFITTKEWVEQQRSAEEAETEARPEKGHAADLPQV